MYISDVAYLNNRLMASRENTLALNDNRYLSYKNRPD